MTQNVLYSSIRARRDLFGAIRRMAGLARQREALTRLDEHLLRDVGISRDEAEREAARAPWDPPAHWR
ncbi:Uncharacterized conserved protein YjiS, DUF1127 family [Poseidonocella pacifica]|uniref:Uncharacterized conserved protein YjiS, DUF1127 family n=1 Tax=Poseidonocella pacifica TaxID=871651 RepID=A0A1I0WC86_9RHOB|nr:DUF1127 domain-containing protein [Poseidonocella pacifica]SFA85516.1 Uncharacterized conserved protein YjiS, DUF1127 family [Poseidonocella pacifica]